MNVMNDGKWILWFSNNGNEIQLKIEFGKYHLWRLKLAKTARKSAENPTCFDSDSFEINTGKSQNNESVLVTQLRENFLL